MRFFSEWFARRISSSKEEKKPLAQLIIRIGQIAVALGIIVSLITMSTGWGAQRSIKSKLTEFAGAINIAPYQSNFALNVDSLKWSDSLAMALQKNSKVRNYQKYTLKSGIIRTSESFEGVVLKGIDSGFNQEQFQQFLVEGKIPTYSSKTMSNQAMVSEKIANRLKITIDSTFLMVFLKENQKPVYRRFQLAGTYQTDIKELDDVYVLVDMRQVQRLNQWSANTVSGVDVFLHNPEESMAISEELNAQIPFNTLAQPLDRRFPFIKDWIAIFDTNVMVILFIMLLVAIINVVMVLLILIIERTPSIGILKTLGAGNFIIQRIFIVYTLLVLVPGMLWGNLIAIGALLAQKFFGVIQLPPENYYISEAPVYLSWEYIVGLNFALIVLSGLTMILPSWYISKISPTKAIRFE